MNTQNLLSKYHHIIAEEINVKNVELLGNDIEVTKTYVPLGKELSAHFGKDTGQIISAAKRGNVAEIGDGKIKVTNNGSEWELDNTQYEIRYSGLTGENQIVEDGAIVELDLKITPDLKAEGIAREISRFLNQMRKDVDYNVSDRVECFFSTDASELQNIIETFTSFLQGEALLSSISQGKESGDITSIFNSEEGDVSFSLKR